MLCLPSELSLNFKFPPFKAKFDQNIIDLAFRTVCEEELEIHVVYAGEYYHGDYIGHETRLRSYLLKGMKKYAIKSVMVTVIYMRRWKLITKEKMENLSLGKEGHIESVNDDLDSVFEYLRLKREPKGSNWTYFLPKLTEEELRLTVRKDPNYFKTFQKQNPDVIKAEMKLSKSKSKFVRGYFQRRTLILEQPDTFLSDWLFKYIPEMFAEI